MFWRLFGTYGVLLLAAIGLLGAVVVGRVEQHYLEHIEDSLRTKAVLVREVIRDRPAGPAPSLQERIVALQPEIATRITLLADDGRVLADSEEDPGTMENHANRPEVRQARGERFGTMTRFSRTLGRPMMYLALRTDGAGGVAFVRVALPLDKVQDQLAGIHRLVWTTVVVTGVAALALAFGLARRMTRPLQELMAGAERIAAGDYGHAVRAAGRDEVGVLARAFNRMSERLAVQFAQLEDDREQLRTILGSMAEGVIALDAAQRVLFANQRAHLLLGLPPETAAGRRIGEVVSHRGLLEAARHALEEPGPYSGELNWDGAAVRSLTVHGVRLPGSPPRGAVLVLHDTTELRRLERLRRDFVANVSHELKTPLSVIKAAVETLLDGAANDPEHRGVFLGQVAAQADRLHALILDLLSLARIEAEAEAFAFQRVAIGSAVADCLERHSGKALVKGQQLRAEPPAPPPSAAGEITAWADEEAVAQILDNLVDNALKYTPAGGRIDVRWRADDGQVCLEVEDTGAGIPEHDLPRIFERFYRVDKARSRELGGTGLGLSIVKHLAQAMRGSVSAASRVGQGARFSVRLPRAAADGSAPALHQTFTPGR